MNDIHRPRPITRTVIAVLLTVVLVAGCGSTGGEVETAVESATPDASMSEPVATTAPVAAPAAEDTLDDDHHEADHDQAVHDQADHDAADHDHDDEADATDTTAAVTTVSQIANASYMESYTLVDESFGTVVNVTVQDGTRVIESNTLPNHETGDFPNSGNPNTISVQDRTWTLTTDPVYTGQATTTRETGVALNGVKFEPGTGESVSCSSGENYRIEGLQETFDLGMDFNNAHVQPGGEYHYHGVSELLVDAFASEGDLVLVGFANDGHMIYYSKSNAYEPSYTLSSAARSGVGCDYRGDPVDIDGTSPDGTYVSDWLYLDGAGDLDECNGTMIGDEYAYLVTEEYPYVPRCLMGESTAAGAGGQGGAPAGAASGNEGGAPDLSAAAAALSISQDELHALLGGPPPDFGAAAEALGLTEADFVAVLAANGAAPPDA